jgi:hypothetical protein
MPPSALLYNGRSLVIPSPSSLALGSGSAASLCLQSRSVSAPGHKKPRRGTSLMTEAIAEDSMRHLSYAEQRSKEV